MATADDVERAALGAVTRKLVESIRALRSDQWRVATPCSDWDLTALIDHVTGGNWFTVAVLGGASAEDAMATTMDRFGAGSAAGEAAVRSLEDQAVAFLQPDALSRTWAHVVGDLSGRQILRLRLHDLIVHSWDLDEAPRPGATLPGDLVRWGLDELGDDDSLTAQHFHGGVVPRPADDDSAAYLEVFGR